MMARFRGGRPGWTAEQTAMTLHDPGEGSAAVRRDARPEPGSTGTTPARIQLPSTRHGSRWRRPAGWSPVGGACEQVAGPLVVVRSSDHVAQCPGERGSRQLRLPVRPGIEQDMHTVTFEVSGSFVPAQAYPVLSEYSQDLISHLSFWRNEVSRAGRDSQFRRLGQPPRDMPPANLLPAGPALLHPRRDTEPSLEFRTAGLAARPAVVVGEMPGDRRARSASRPRGTRLPGAGPCSC
jgi:hypothetical protein